MSDFQAAQAHNATAPAAVVARPRISADAFRSLTARLKKTETAIPDVIPALAVPQVQSMPQPAAPVVPAIVAEAPPVIKAEPAPVILAEPLPPPAPLVPEPAIAVMPESPAAMAPAPVVETAFETMLDIAPVAAEAVVPAPRLVEAAAPASAELLIEALLPAAAPSAERGESVKAAATAPVANETLGIEPLDALATLPDTAAAPVAEVVVAPVTDVLMDLPQAEPEPEAAPPAAAVVEVQSAPALDAALPDLPPFVAKPVFVPEPVQEVVPPPPPPPASMPMSGGFAANFTYVPQAGEEAPKPALTAAELSDIDEAVRQELAQRATELELENIWRMLLAKPTAEDRATYMREAAEYHADDEEWNKPDPEHDLSSIQPAATAEVALPTEAEAAFDAAAPSEVVNPVPQVAGQDVAELARSLLDMMASGNASGLPQERALAADTLLRLVPRLDLKPVILLAERLAMMDSPPHLLVSRLIRDPRPEVAGPLLEDCMQIPDKDLEALVLEGDPDKLRLIARRRRLSRAISDALIKSGDPSVVLTLIRNAEAEISHDGFQSLIVLCENNPDLLAPLATRHDLSAPFAFELFWLAPAQLRRFILSRFLTDSETLTKILKITMATNLEDEGEGEGLSQHSLLEALERAARGHVEVAAEELATLLQVAPATVARVLGDLEGEPLVVMLKAAGYPRSAMAGLLKRMQEADLPIISRNRDITELQMMFETLSFNKARILLTYWDWAVVKLGPYAPVH